MTRITPRRQTLRRSLLGTIAGVASATVLPLARARESKTVVHLTAPAGIGEYEWALTHDRILARHSAWLRKRSQPTQGYIFNLRTALEPSTRLDELVFNCDPISPWLAERKQPPFQSGLGKLRPLGLMNCAWPIWMFVTRNPAISKPSDLAGKRVALGPRAGTASLMGEELLKATGLHGKVKLQHLAFPDIVKGLLDDTIEVGYANLWYNAQANKLGTTQGIINLEASGKDFHYVAFDRAQYESTRKDRGIPIQIVDVPDKTVPLQTRPMTVMANADYVAVDASMPDDVAYEIVRTALQYLPEINETGGMASIFTKEFMPYRIDAMHPGAKRAYVEAGLVR
ncbi:MAG: TAXI family TRAP transporter solute-binding subunit [Lautropia sp.]